jgi:hypothetical protein
LSSDSSARRRRPRSPWASNPLGWAGLVVKPPILASGRAELAATQRWMNVSRRAASNCRGSWR